MFLDVSMDGMFWTTTIDGCCSQRNLEAFLFNNEPLLKAETDTPSRGIKS